MEPVLAFAESRAEIGYIIDAHTYQVMVHLAKLYLFPGARERNHWCHEVWVHFKGLPKLKPTNKLPDAHFIFERSWEANVDYLSDAIEDAIKDEDSLTPRSDCNAAELSAIMDQYFTWLSSKLSCGPLHGSDVYPKLDELGL